MGSISSRLVGGGRRRERTTVLLVMGAALCGLPSAKLERDKYGVVNDERSNRFLAAVQSWGISVFRERHVLFCRKVLSKSQSYPEND